MGWMVGRWGLVVVCASACASDASSQDDANGGSTHVAADDDDESTSLLTASADDSADECATSSCSDPFEDEGPICEPEWTACDVTPHASFEFPSSGLVLANIVASPAWGITVVVGANRGAEHLYEATRFDADGETLWDHLALPVSYSIVSAMAGSADGSLIFTGRVPGTSPAGMTLTVVGPDGALVWSRSPADGDELVQRECTTAAHDPEVGWLVVCRVDDDGASSLHTYDASGGFVASVPLEGVATWDAGGYGGSRMLASGDGDVVLSSRAAGIGSLQRFDIATGANVWSFDFAGPTTVFTAPGFAFGPEGDVAAMWEGELHLVDPSGVVIWSAPAAPVEPECTYEPVFDHVAWAGDSFALVATSTHWGVLRHYLVDGTVVCNDVVGGVLDVPFAADGNDGAWLWVTDGVGRTLTRARPP